jgi:peptidoglycan/LPS O-acetylase OafA/YrhL
MNRIKELDGIRGLAILMVLILHYFYQLSLGSVDNGSLLVHLHNFTHWFWSGVDLFFVLSGFLIGGIIIDNRESKNFLQVFYIRRALRILPAYSLLLIAFYALRSQLDPARFGALFYGNAPIFPEFSYFTFTQNIFLGLAFAMHRDSAIFLGPTWSLAVEEQFYMVVPFCFLITPRRYWVSLLVWLAILALVLRMLFPEQLPYVVTPFRMDSLFLGVLAALVVRRVSLRALLQERKWILRSAFLLLLVMVVWFVAEGKLVWRAPQYSVLACFYTVLLLIAVIESGSLPLAIFRFPPLRFLGLISYGLYLFNMPILWLFHGLALGARPSLNSGIACAVTLISLIVSIALASISYFFFERRFLSLGHSLRYKKGRKEVDFRERQRERSLQIPGQT